MQLFPNKLRLALNTVLFIVCYGNEIEPVSSKTIVEQCENMNDRTLEPVLQKLAKANVVQSIKGANGGYYVDDPDNLTVRHVVEAMLDKPDNGKYTFLGLEDVEHEAATKIYDGLIEKTSYISFAHLKNRAQEKGLISQEEPVLNFVI
ncbi:MAG: Rrf2 family transcriptional regulator [Alphaproteobacteria bacterium]|nr:Rrf2 family transcriptional regulator [Alphaproteobacteria bacterium]